MKTYSQCNTIARVYHKHIIVWLSSRVVKLAPCSYKYFFLVTFSMNVLVVLCNMLTNKELVKLIKSLQTDKQSLKATHSTLRDGYKDSVPETHLPRTINKSIVSCASVFSKKTKIDVVKRIVLAIKVCRSVLVQV